MKELKSSGVRLLHPEKLFAALPPTWEYFCNLGLEAEGLEVILRDSAAKVRSANPQIAGDKDVKSLSDSYYLIQMYMETCFSLLEPYFKEKIGGLEKVNEDEIREIIRRSREEKLHFHYFSTLFVYGLFKYLFPTPEIDQKDN